MKNFNDHEKGIIRKNWMCATVLILTGVLVGLSNYFEVLVIPVAVVASIVALFCGFVCMMQTIHQSWWGYDPVESLWIPVSVFGAVIGFAALIFSEFLAEHAMKSLFFSAIPIMVPIIGWQLGLIANAFGEIASDMRFR